MDSSRTECHNTATQLGFMGEKIHKGGKDGGTFPASFVS